MTYNPALTEPRDIVRLLIGDIDDSNEIFEDATYDAVLAALGVSNTLAAAATMAEQAAAKFSRSTSFSVEGLSISNVQKSQNYFKLAANLRDRIASGEGPGLPGGIDPNAAAAAIVSGVSFDQMATIDSNPDRPPSAFRVGMMDPNYPSDDRGDIITGEDLVQ